MKCFYCQNEMTETTTTYLKELGENLIIIRHVPCYKCEECGEKAYSAEVLMRVEEIIDKLKETFTEIAVVNYTAA